MKLLTTIFKFIAVLFGIWLILLVSVAFLLGSTGNIENEIKTILPHPKPHLACPTDCLAGLPDDLFGGPVISLHILMFTLLVAIGILIAYAQGKAF